MNMYRYRQQMKVVSDEIRMWSNLEHSDTTCAAVSCFWISNFTKCNSNAGTFMYNILRLSLRESTSDYVDSVVL